MNTKYFMFCLVNFMSFVNIHPWGQEQFRASNEVNWLNNDVI